MFFDDLKVLLIKAESPEGTDSVPTPAANYIAAKNIKVSYPDAPLERDLARTTFSQDAPLAPAEKHMEITFDVEVKGSGTAGVAPRIGDALEACGMAEAIGVVGGSSSCAYTPSTTQDVSVTIYFYELQHTGNARLHKLLGAKGSYAIKADSGKVATRSFKFYAKYTAPTEVAAPTGMADDNATPPVVESAAFSLNSVTTLVVQSVSLDLGQEVSMREDVSSSGSIKGYRITGRKPKGTFNPEAVLAATHDFYGDWVAATARALSMQIGTVAANKITITAPKLVLEKVDNAARNNIVTHDIPFQLVKNAGNDEYVESYW